MEAYRLYARPPEAGHGHPYLVFDCKGELHMALTTFAKIAHAHVAPPTVQKYLVIGVLPFMTWLDTDTWQVRANRRWDDPPDIVRGMVRDYVVSQLGCIVRTHPDGFELVANDGERVNGVRFLLAGLRLFYRISAEHGYYHHDDPLKASFARGRHDAVDQASQGRPKMPDISGVDAPRGDKRLTDSYFKLVNDQWVPQVVTDLHLPMCIIEGGRTLRDQRGKAWGLREECIISLLFETGARVSEVCGLTLGDWYARGLKDTAWTRNKGSRKRFAKFVRFSPQTQKLLRRYFDSERSRFDPKGYTLSTYLSLAKQRHVDLHTVPLFLSRRGTPWTPASFRANYWKQACEAASVDVDIHQARHWYVTRAMAEVHAQARRGEATVEAGLQRLIAYMKWRSGDAVLAAYNHYYDPAAHAAVQDRIFKTLRMRQAQGRRGNARLHARPSTDASGAMPGERGPVIAAPDAHTNELYAFLMGTGGCADDLFD